MFGFLKSLLGFSDRAQAASERAATALEGLADDLEAVRGIVRERLGLVQAEEPAQLPAKIVQPTVEKEPLSDEPFTNSKARRKVKEQA